MRVQDIKKKSSHSLQAVSELVLGVLRIGNSGAFAFICCELPIHTHFPEPSRLEDMAFTGFQYADK